VGADDYLFRYDAKAQAQSAVSLTMPVRAEEYRRRELHPIFQMNLPEGYVLEQLRNRLAKTVKVDPMLLLALSGSSAPNRSTPRAMPPSPRLCGRFAHRKTNAAR
jgi:serine/threonine-protein kinase HipA